MGNQQISRQGNHVSTKQLSLQKSYMAHMGQVQSANLIKFVGENQSDKRTSDSSQSGQSSLFYLEKVFVSDSDDEYRFMTKYLQKQSILGFQSQSSQIIKIVKIYQQAEKGFCSNRYLIRALFQYSDITMREQVQVRSGGAQKGKEDKECKKHYFKYQDLCNIMFACISSALAVYKMKHNFNKFLQKNKQLVRDHYRNLEYFLSQFKYNIPMNLDRIIVMPDGTIKIMHPLLLNHQDRVCHSRRFLYSPQKMRDFQQDDGIKGRIFQIALVVLQCALVQTTQQMSRVYNGYCINQKVLSSKLLAAINIYQNQQGRAVQEIRLFSLIRKMIVISPQNRIDLEQCIKEAQSLFQLNKRLKQPVSVTKDSQKAKTQKERMSVQQLWELPCHKRSKRQSAMLTNSGQGLTTVARSRDKDEQRTTGGVGSDKIERQGPDREQIRVSNFNLYVSCGKGIESTRQNTCRNPLESLFINNQLSHQDTRGLQSLIGKDSNLYNTKRFNFMQSKHQYGGFCQNNKIQQHLQSNQSIQKQSDSSLFVQQFMYQKLINKPLVLKRKLNQKRNSVTREKFLRARTQQKQEKFLISKSKFMDLDKVYDQYDFIQKSEPQQSHHLAKLRQSKNQIFQCRNSHHTIQKDVYSTSKMEVPLTYSLQNSENSKIHSANKKSQVIQKFTSDQILKIKLQQAEFRVCNY